MYLVQNFLPIESAEQSAMLKERFRQAPESMKAVPGFISFRLLEAEDQTHFIAETVFEKKEDFLAWIQSEHFMRAHGGQKGESDSPGVKRYNIVY